MDVKRALSPHSQMSATWFIITATLVNMALFHVPLYRYAISHLDMRATSGIATFCTLLMVVFVVTAVSLAALCILSRHLIKSFCMLAALLNASAVYFMVTYSVMLDKTTMENIYNTRSEESLDFLHPKLFLFVFFLGLVPAWLISRVHIEPVKRVHLALQAACLVATGLVFIYVNSFTWLWFDKHAKHLGGRILPWAYIGNTIRLKVAENRGQKTLSLLPAATFADNERVLVVLVIGEAARAQNFSLYGYDRETNPRLQQADIAVLRGTKACSTYTTASLHCMLSRSGTTSGSDEPLPSYLQRLGVDVIWRTNNWGEPPLVVQTYQKASELRESCSGKHCEFDDVLLSHLGDQINQSVAPKIFVTLHTKGSHGPSYYSSYPSKFGVFKPVCETVDLSDCTAQSLVNAYDNTIVYTDDFLSRSIQLLSSFSDIPTVLIYVSDHGESLGEFGLYLHGTPYSIAPDVLKDIPFIVWMSESFRIKKGVSNADLERPDTHSHSQIFHSILGALSAQGGAYNPELDIFDQKSHRVPP